MFVKIKVFGGGKVLINVDHISYVEGSHIYLSAPGSRDRRAIHSVWRHGKILRVLQRAGAQI